ncbi:MAG: type III-B CRISPR module RAMP protein Cmr6 [Thermodesulfobacteriota bacterium]
MPFGVVEVKREGRDENWYIQTDSNRFKIDKRNLKRNGWGELREKEIVSGLDVEFELVNNSPGNVRRYSPLPENIRKILNQHGCEHAGLVLDKYSFRYSDQELARGILDQVIQVNNTSKLFYDAFLQRWLSFLESSSALTFQCRTIGPLTLHLARASALENAGICLHPIYGFVYLPGSGLKGMARAFAETVWLPAQSDKKSAGWRIEDVFGWAPNPERKEKIKNNIVEQRWEREGDPASPEIKAHAGSIVFHDAWPEKWPKLILDIVNNHHMKYYQGEDAPGDWENPTMVSFLTIDSGNAFTFAFSKRRSDIPDHLLSLVKEWLTGALCHLGAGAKTAAGYGAFEPVEGTRPKLPDSEKIKTYETTLELVTPAFLAGANQKVEDCDLRPATLRGLLRWWWRTMHAGFVDVDTLRSLESAIWGDTKQGGAIRVELMKKPDRLPKVTPCPLKKMGKNIKGQDILVPDESFINNQSLLQPPPMTTPPLIYISYGMDEMKTGEVNTRKRRHVVWPGAAWVVRLIANPSKYKDKLISAADILTQAKLAILLLCRYGGVGSKGRKGFGSFADLAGPNRDECLKTAREFRRTYNIQEQSEKDGDSPALNRMLPAEIVTPWKNAWFALDRLGAAVQAFTQASQSSGHGKHCESKLALGLPRKIHGPLNFKLPHQKEWTAPRELKGPKGERHSSPVHYHLAKDKGGNLTIRLTAFPSIYLPNINTSNKILKDLLNHLNTYLKYQIKNHGDKGQEVPLKKLVDPIPEISLPMSTALPRTNEMVQAVMQDEKTKKGGWRSKHIASGVSGPILNSADVPTEIKVGESVTLKVVSVNQKEITFRWPTTADEKQIRKGPRPGGPLKKQR